LAVVNSLMKKGMSAGFVISILILTVWVSTPKVMAIDLNEESNGYYTSEICHLPVSIQNATLDISVLMDTFLRLTLELKVGNCSLCFHLNDLSITGHFQYNIFEFFGKITSRDIALALYVDTDGIIQGTPRAFITYYGLF
jgi:hypothetical protein